MGRSHTPGGRVDSESGSGGQFPMLSCGPLLLVMAWLAFSACIPFDIFQSIRGRLGWDGYEVTQKLMIEEIGRRMCIVDTLNWTCIADTLNWTCMR